MPLSTMPAADYHALDAISSHRLADFAKSPRGYHANHRREQTAGMSLGTLVHLVTLEPHRRSELATDAPTNPTTGRPYGSDTVKARDWRDATIAAGKIPTDQADLDLADVLAANCREVAPSALTPEGPAPGWEAESVITHTDDVVGLCKARPDLLNVSGRGIIDLKTCRDLDRFRFDVTDYDYALQAAWYVRMASTLEYAPWSWRWLVVETQAPYRARVVRWDSVIMKAADRIQPLLDRLAQCRETNQWPLTLNDGVLDMDR